MVSDPGRGASGNSMLCLPHPLPRRVVQEAAQVLSFPLKNLVRIRVDPALLGSIRVHYRFFFVFDVDYRKAMSEAKLWPQ